MSLSSVAGDAVRSTFDMADAKYSVNGELCFSDNRVACGLSASTSVHEIIANYCSPAVLLNILASS